MCRPDDFPPYDEPIHLPRAFACVECDQPIHEKKGEANHIYLEDENGDEYGPYCPTCANNEVAPE